MQPIGNYMQLLIATRNRHKLSEISAILKLPGVELCSIADWPTALPEVVEDGATFEANALKKAATLADASGVWALADDSGLEVDALGGAPGVWSSRYAGREGDDAANNRKLLRELARHEQRHARFRCVMVLAAPDGRNWSVAGVCEGVILQQPEGDGGFGYDPLFQPLGYSRSFAALPAAVKNSISHRAKALQQAAEAWRDLICER